MGALTTCNINYNGQLNQGSMTARVIFILL